MKFARLFTILLIGLTVLLMNQDKALARPADRIVQPSHAEFDHAGVLIDLEPLALAPDPEPEPEPDPEPDPDPWPDPLPEPPYSS